MTLAPSTRIGNYEILGPLGAGGMGEVYRARDTRLDRQWPQDLAPGVSQDPNRLDRFEREAKLLASLNHPKSPASAEDAQGVTRC
jgi:serine/threonine protein kinase